MTFSLPNPTTPTNGQPGDATPILQNELAIAQAIQNFDGSQINSKTVTETALADAVNPRLRGSETLANFVYSGCLWSIVSGLNGTMTGGTIYVNGYRTIVTGVGSNTFGASKDTYVDIDYLGNLTYNAVANNATAPSLTANAIRVAKVVTSGSAITTITQAQNADGIGNIIYPSGPATPAKMQNPYKFLAYRNAAYNVPGANVAFVFDVKDYDTGNNYNNSTGVFTAPVNGFYQFAANIIYVFSSSGKAINIILYKNSSAHISSQAWVSTYGGGSFSETVVGNFPPIQLTAGDTIFIGQTSIATADGTPLGVGVPRASWFGGFLVSAT